MKTTLDIDDALLVAAKQRALDTGGTLRQVVEDALAAHLKVRPAVATPIKTLVYSGTPLASGTFAADACLHELAYSQNDPQWWLQRFGFVPPGLRPEAK